MAFKIDTITGLGYLSGLTRLTIVVNNLTTIDISQNTNLEALDLYGNQFTEEFLNNLPLSNSLTYLNFGGNSIVNFDPVNALPSGLTGLDLYNNQIVTFDPTLPLPSGLIQLVLNGNNIVTFNPTLALPSGLTGLYLNNNQIVTFDPPNLLPSSLTNLSLNNNQIVTFNPTLNLPISLTYLNLGSNEMTTAGYTASEPWANAMTVIPGRGNIYFGDNVNSPSGTNLKTILIAKGWTIIA